MKIKAMLLIVVTLSISSCSSYQSFQSWNWREKSLEAAYLATSWIDYTQTRKVTDEGRELNPHLGEHPTKEEIARYFVITRILHFGVACYLEHDDRETWLSFWLGASSSTIYFNWRQGF